MAVLVSVLAYTSQATKRLFFGLLPLGLVALLYDGMRFVKNVGLTESNVHLCDLRNAELRWFGVNTGAARVTIQDWCQAHASIWLDVLCAIPYGTFLLVVASYALFLFFRDFSAQQRFAWGFLLLNVAGFLTYHLYPAAPPWYYHQHGCVVDLQAAASAGPNLERVDALVGVAYFTGFYGRASDIFGAIPSLHVAYPLLMAVEGWRRHNGLGRSLLVLFYAAMCFSAVYLDHHWVVDILVGSGYALIVALAIRRVGLAARRAAPGAGVVPAGESETE